MGTLLAAGRLSTRLGESDVLSAPPTVGDRLFAVSRGVGLSTYGPTASHRNILEIATTEMADLRNELERHERGLSELVCELIDAGAPPAKR